MKTAALLSWEWAGDQTPERTVIVQWRDTMTEIAGGLMSRTPKKVRAFGEEKLLSEWKADPRCRVCASAVDRRIGRGWTPERALATPAGGEFLCSAFGESKTVPEWARDPRCEVSLRTLHARLARGEPLEEALKRPAFKPAPTRARKGKRWTAFGKSLTASEWSEDPRCAVPANTLRMRLKNLDPETAISKPLASHERECPAHGETKSLRAWSKDPRCLVSYESLLQRLDRGWELERAMSVPRLSKGSPGNKKGPRARKPSSVLPGGREVALEAFGEEKTLREWADDPRCQVPYLRLRIRLKNHWPLEEAISTVPAVGNSNVEAFGESKSLYAWEQDPRCLVSCKTLRYRMERGESLESAMTRPPENERVRRFWSLPDGAANAKG